MDLSGRLRKRLSPLLVCLEETYNGSYFLVLTIGPAANTAQGHKKGSPVFVSEYSTATDVDGVTFRAINPADSRFLSVLVSMRCETFPRRRAQLAVTIGLLLE